MIIANRHCAATTLTFFQFVAAGIHFEVDSGITPFPLATIRVGFTDTGTLGGSTNRGVAFPKLAFIVKAAGTAHGDGIFRRTKTRFATAGKALILLCADCAIAQLGLAGSLPCDGIATVLARPAIGVVLTFIRLDTFTQVAAVGFALAFVAARFPQRLFRFTDITLQVEHAGGAILIGVAVGISGTGSFAAQSSQPDVIHLAVVGHKLQALTCGALLLA